MYVENKNFKLTLYNIVQAYLFHDFFPNFCGTYFRNSLRVVRAPKVFMPLLCVFVHGHYVGVETVAILYIVPVTHLD